MKLSICEGNKKYIIRQYIVGLACFLESIGCGVVMSFTGTLFPQLEEDETFAVDKQDETWIASSAILSMAFGCIIGGISMRFFARNTLMIVMNILMMVGFVVIYFSETISLLILGRTLCGLAMGVSRPVIVSIVAEVTAPSIRPLFTNIIVLGHIAGGLLSDIVATFADWRWNAITTCLYPAAATLLFAFVVIEPYGSHIDKKRLAKAKQSFLWYRGTGEEAKKEIDMIITLANNENDQFSLKLLDRKFFKAFCICSVFFAAGQFNGINVLSLYSVEIFRKMIQGVNGNYVTIVYDCVKIAASISGAFIIKRFKVRTLTFVSATGVIASLLSLSFLYYLQKGQENSLYNYLTCFDLVFYVQCLLFGLVPLPWGAPPELFQGRLRGFGSGCTIFLNYLFYFIAVKFAPSLLDVSYSLTFALFAILTGILSIVLFYVLPETKNKTLQDAQATILS